MTPFLVPSHLVTSYVVNAGVDQLRAGPPHTFSSERHINTRIHGAYGGIGYVWVANILWRRETVLTRRGAGQ